MQEGRVTTMTQRNGPFANFTSAFVQDNDGFLWVGIDAGAAILRFHRREMDRVAADPSHYVVQALRPLGRTAGRSGVAAESRVGGPRHGWPPVVCVGRYADRDLSDAACRRVRVRWLRALTPSGWIAHSVRRRPRRGCRRARASSRFDWSAISLGAASKLRFRYRLEGTHREWVYAGARRNVTYNGLAAGRYRFKVSATYDGVWTDGEDWDFIVPPPFYLSAWFLMLAGLSIAAIIASASWLRVRMIRERYALVFAERALVSREIHDTLLQNLCGDRLRTRRV